MFRQHFKVYGVMLVLKTCWKIQGKTTCHTQCKVQTDIVRTDQSFKYTKQHTSIQFGTIQDGLNLRLRIISAKYSEQDKQDLNPKTSLKIITGNYLFKIERRTTLPFK